MEKKYEEIIAPVERDFLILDNEIKKVLTGSETQLNPYIEKFLFSTSKRIRSAVIFLLSYALFGKIFPKAIRTAVAIELLHNASLIHDDIIDEAKERRGQASFNSEFNNKLAVIAGDFLFSMAFELIVKDNDSSAVLAYIETFKNLCKGEIEQFFEKEKIPAIENYIKKSDNKTASLFCIGVENAFKNEVSNIRLKNLTEFAKNFGIAFQLNNDLKNIFDGAKDFKDGIYTAAIIFAYEKNKDITKAEYLLEELEMVNAIDRTRNLIKTYTQRAVANLSCVGDNVYKSALISLCEFIEEI